MFTYNDIDILSDLLKQFAASCTTNSILTEVSNLLGQAPAHRRRILMNKLAEYTASVSELNLPSADLVKLDVFLQLGLTDAGLRRAAKDYTIITTDFRLAGHILTAGFYSINFNHLRGNQLLVR